jgi:3'-phosphoadenosine 5'-phosphosulfate sulfotransferase (PAPS reductase)/FAD synthetase
VNNKEREMAKTAQQKFNEHLDECRKTTDAINEFVNTSFDNNQSYAYSTGAMSVMLGELIQELPRTKREYWRDRLHRAAQQQKNEYLLKTIKEAA